MCKVLGSVPSTARKGGAEALKFKARQNNGVLVSNSLHVWPSHQTLPSGVSLSRHTCEGHTTQQHTAHKHWCELTTDCMQRLPFADWRTYSNRTMRKKWKHLACPCFRVSKLHFPYKSSKVRGKKNPTSPHPSSSPSKAHYRPLSFTVLLTPLQDVLQAFLLQSLAGRFPLPGIHFPLLFTSSFWLHGSGLTQASSQVISWLQMFLQHHWPSLQLSSYNFTFV